MLAYTYLAPGAFQLLDKPKPALRDDRDAIVRVTLSSICTSDLHIKHGSVPRAVPGVTVGHEMVGVVEEVGSAVIICPARETGWPSMWRPFAGSCFFCQQRLGQQLHGPRRRLGPGLPHRRRPGGVCPGALCRPGADSDSRTVSPTGRPCSWGTFWPPATGRRTFQRSRPGDTVLILGAGPTGICTLQCVLLKQPGAVIVCEQDPLRRCLGSRPTIPRCVAVGPEQVRDCVVAHSAHGGADVVLEVAGAGTPSPLAWQCARPNAVVTVVALYDGPQVLPLPDMYGKNLTFKTGGCGRLPLRRDPGPHCRRQAGHHRPHHPHLSPCADIAAAYELFEHRRDGVIKVAVEP